MPYLSLTLLLIVAGLLLLAVVVHLMARALIRPPRMTDGKALYVLKRLTPRDIGLSFEAMTFEVDDVLAPGQKQKLAAWWMPADQPSGRTVVLVHGYADAKVGVLAWAPGWHELGFNLLAVDLRAHGDSTGTICTGGYAERHDLVQVVHQILARKPAETASLMLFGASLGAAAVAGAAAELDPELVAGVVLESPYADFRSASAAHFERIGLPGGRIARLALRHAEWLSGARYGEVRVTDLVGRIQSPLLVLAAGDDLYLTGEEAEALAAAVAARPASSGASVYRRFEGVEHLMSVVASPDEYRQALSDFVGQLKPASEDRGTSTAHRQNA